MKDFQISEGVYILSLSLFLYLSIYPSLSFPSFLSFTSLLNSTTSYIFSSTYTTLCIVIPPLLPLPFCKPAIFSFIFCSFISWFPFHFIYLSIFYLLFSLFIFFTHIPQAPFFFLILFFSLTENCWCKDIFLAIFLSQNLYLLKNKYKKYLI